MSTTKESDRKMLAELYSNMAEVSGLVKDVLSSGQLPGSSMKLQQAQQILQKSQGMIVAAAAKNAISGYQKSNDVMKKPELSLAKATALIHKIEIEATRRGLSVVIAVYDASANPVAVHCMDHAYIASYDIAVNKAYTSAALKMPTSVLKNLSQPGQELYGIQFTNQGRIVIFGGGELLRYNDQLIGALGVSGASESEDTSLAEFGRDIMEEVMNW